MAVSWIPEQNRHMSWKSQILINIILHTRGTDESTETMDIVTVAFLLKFYTLACHMQITCVGLVQLIR